MRNVDSRLAGILGTVILHLIAGIIFVSFKIHSLKKYLPGEFAVEFAQVTAPPESKEKPIELPSTHVERILQGDEEMLNIARNLANKPDVKINPSDYIDEVKNELIREGKLGEDNYIDEQKKLNENTKGEDISISKDKKPATDASQKKSLEMAANYAGPTRIYYYLPGRQHLYLPIPIYKCEGSGKVVLAINVNQEGFVEEAKVLSEVSSTSDPCLTETAVNTALASRFNPDANSPKIQAGTITYEFVAQ